MNNLICTNCYDSDRQTTQTELTVKLENRNYTLRNLQCETCPKCGDVIFTHQQSLEVDKRRLMLEYALFGR